MSNESLSSVGVKLALDQQTYQLLSRSAKASFRSLKKEATLRIIDHVERAHSVTLERKPDNIAFRTSINIPIETKQAVTKSLYRGQFKVKTLVDECSARLKDHLLRYPTISAVGVVQERKHAS
ncbi:TraY domain-containing protein [Vibrio alginolyticus]|uniref:TraY domain-containing protein n=1 Tax=Vibrio alginolyticus TaxID=663 RepID=UPI00215BAF47|nr:TraY domain-containing protein [Vibrio alginolyticus]MCR9998705.1 TraY domain-containing protein [Vibrio alginolyticus]